MNATKGSKTMNANQAIRARRTATKLANKLIWDFADAIVDSVDGSVVCFRLFGTSPEAVAHRYGRTVRLGLGGWELNGAECAFPGGKVVR